MHLAARKHPGRPPVQNKQRQPMNAEKHRPGQTHFVPNQSIRPSTMSEEHLLRPRVLHTEEKKIAGPRAGPLTLSCFFFVSKTLTILDPVLTTLTPGFKRAFKRRRAPIGASRVSLGRCARVTVRSRMIIEVFSEGRAPQMSVTRLEVPLERKLLRCLKVFTESWMVHVRVTSWAILGDVEAPDVEPNHLRF